MNPLLQAALEYRELGWSVIPLSPGSKIPPKGFSVIPYRTELATEAQIKDWWKENPNYNIGIITGKLSNLFVVDLDKSKDKYREENAIIHFGDNINTPITETPSGGNHLYYNYEPGITIGENILPAIDFRGEGGYIVSPPSMNNNGGCYKWLQSFKDFSRSQCPASFRDAIINISTFSVCVTQTQNCCDNAVTSVTSCDIWQDGERDKNLFHIANCLIKTNNSEDYIYQTLRAIMSSWGECDEKWIDAKIKSAIDRQERKNRNIQAEVDAWIGVTTGDFSVTTCTKELGMCDKRDIVSVRKALSRRKDTTIEKAGCRDGWWRRIDTEIEHLDFDEPEGIEYPVFLPFELHDFVEICQGNIVLISGEFNAGKSLFALTTLLKNKGRLPIRYMSSEMKVSEIKKRFHWFGIEKELYWPDKMCSYVALRNNISTLLLPDGLNIIDYLEFPEGDYTRGAEYMRQIHDKLTTGIAIVCNQQKEGARLPRSGDLILEKPRLAVTLRKIATENDEIIGVAEVIKAKNVKIGKMDGKKLKYEIKKMGSQFKTIINWGYWR